MRRNVSRWSYRQIRKTGGPGQPDPNGGPADFLITLFWIIVAAAIIYTLLAPPA